LTQIYAPTWESYSVPVPYDMVNSGQATLIDLRTLEECYWVGSPALAPGGDPIAVVIPWQIITIDNSGTVTKEDNSDFDTLVLQEFGDDNDQALIVMCRSGKRSTAAAEELERLGFTNLYEIDNYLKEREKEDSVGGRGGFQGTSYKNTYDGYRGHPERLPENNSVWKITVETYTEDINNTEDSVSWMDIGLPITQKIDPYLIPTLE
ncbi:MAG: rhodanese-like domain-containing protein, partial [Desulfobacteria bacterium]